MGCSGPAPQGCSAHPPLDCSGLVSLGWNAQTPLWAAVFQIPSEAMRLVNNMSASGNTRFFGVSSLVAALVGQHV